MSDEKRYFEEITQKTIAENGVVSLAIRPNQKSQYGTGGLSGKELQQRFDKLATLIIARYNEVAKALSSTAVLEYFKLPNGVTLSDFISKITDEDLDIVSTSPYLQEKAKLANILKSLFNDVSAEVGERKSEVQRLDGRITAESNERIDSDDLLNRRIESVEEAQAALEESKADTNEKIDELDTTLTNVKALVDEFFNSGTDDDNTIDRLHELIDMLNKNAATIDVIGKNKVDKDAIVRDYTELAKAGADAVAGAKLLYDYFVSKEDLNRYPLDDYVTEDALNHILEEYVHSEDLSSYINESKLQAALAQYVTVSALNEALNNYAQKGDLEDLVDSQALVEALKGYAKSDELSKFIDTDKLNAALQGYATLKAIEGLVTNERLSEAVKGLVTDEELSAAVEGLVSSESLDGILGNYALTSDVNSIIDTEIKEALENVAMLPEDTNDIFLEAFATNGSYGLEYGLYDEAALPYAECLGIGVCKDKSIVIGSIIKRIPVERVASAAFAKQTNIKSITLPYSVTSVGDRAFSACPDLESILVESGNAYFVSSGGVLYSNEGPSVVQCPAGKTGHVDLLSTARAIGSYSFEACKLSSLSIGNALAVVRTSAFADCDNLIDVYYYGTDASFKSVNVQAGNDVIYKSLCYYLDNTVNPLSKWQYYKRYWRYDDNGVIQEVANHTTGLELVANANENTWAVAGVGTNTSVKQNLFKLPYKHEGGLVTKINDSAFLNKNNVLTVCIPSSIKEIGMYAFSGCQSLSRVIICRGVSKIRYGCFASSVGGNDHKLFVYYEGTAEEWQSIEIGGNNERLNSAVFQYEITTETLPEFTEEEV